jgi:predicted RecA/RadA family phage recombinase
MPQARRIQCGDAIDHTPSGALTAGDVVVQQALVGVAPQDVAANALGAVEIEQVWRCAKDASVFAVGDPAYWDDTNNQMKADPSVGPYAGIVVKAAATGDSTVDVRLDPTAAAGRRLLYSAVAASAAVSNTTVETAFDKSVSIPANTLKAGDVIRVRAQGIATLTNSTDTLDVALRLGTTDVVVTGAVDVANNDLFFLDVDITIRTIGAGGTMVAAGHTALGAAGTVTAKPKLLASTALDTTAAISVNVSATWSVASAGNSVRLDILNVELIRK